MHHIIMCERCLSWRRNLLAALQPPEFPSEERVYTRIRVNSTGPAQNDTLHNSSLFGGMTGNLTCLPQLEKIEWRFSEMNKSAFLDRCGEVVDGSRIKVVTRLRPAAGRLQPDVSAEGQSETLWNTQRRLQLFLQWRTQTERDDWGEPAADLVSSDWFLCGQQLKQPFTTPQSILDISIQY